MLWNTFCEQSQAEIAATAAGNFLIYSSDTFFGDEDRLAISRIENDHRLSWIYVKWLRTKDYETHFKTAPGTPDFSFTALRPLLLTEKGYLSAELSERMTAATRSVHFELLPEKDAIYLDGIIYRLQLPADQPGIRNFEWNTELYTGLAPLVPLVTLLDEVLEKIQAAAFPKG